MMMMMMDDDDDDHDEDNNDSVMNLERQQKSWRCQRRCHHLADWCTFVKRSATSWDRQASTFWLLFAFVCFCCDCLRIPCSMLQLQHQLTIVQAKNASTINWTIFIWAHSFCCETIQHTLQSNARLHSRYKDKAWYPMNTHEWWSQRNRAIAMATYVKAIVISCSLGWLKSSHCVFFAGRPSRGLEQLEKGTIWTVPDPRWCGSKLR